MIRRPFVFIYIFMYKVFSIITQFIPVVNVFPAAARCHAGTAGMTRLDISQPYFVTRQEV